MHLFSVASLKNRALIVLITIVAMFFGVISLTGLKQELMPSVEFPAIAVVTSYPGASSEVVLSDVSKPIEEAVRGVSALEQTSSTSRTGASMVVLEFTYGTDIIATEQKVERAISRISSLLPESVDPQVVSGSIDDFPVIQIAVGAKSDEQLAKSVDLLETLAVPELENIDGVRQVQVDGASRSRVTITPDEKKLKDLGLSNATITDALRQNGALLPAGAITDGSNTLPVQIGGSLESVEALEKLPLVSAAGASPAAQPTPVAESDFPVAPVAPPTELEVTLLKDVASVKLENDPVTSISRINGDPSVTIAVTKLSSANTVQVSHAVQEKLSELEDAFGGVSFTVIFDQAPYIEQSIETLAVEGLLGLVFAILVILFFLLSVRATLVTAVSIPTSVLLTFIGLNFADYTLNLLTLGALTISIGRVVDDSIVVIENIKRHLAEDNQSLSRGESIIVAVREVAGAITASTITTVAVFLPMAFVSGMVGELFRPFAFTITIALLASLIVSLTIVPVLAYWFLKSRRPSEGAEASRAVTERAEARPEDASLVGIERAQAEPDPQPKTLADGSPVTKLQKTYLPVIDFTLKKPFVTLLLSLVVFAGTIAAYPLMKTSFLGEDEQNAVRLTQTLDPGTSVDEQLSQVKRVEETLLAMNDVETVQVTIGSGAGMAAIFGGGADGSISYSLTTNADANQAELQDEIRGELNKLSEAGEFTLSTSNGGPTGSSTVDITVTAPNQKLLAEGALKVQEALADRSEFSQVDSNLATSRPTVQVTINREAAAKFGLTEIMASQMVAAAMQPQAIGQIVLEDTSIRVYIAQPESPEDLDAIKAFKVQTAFGEKQLADIATVEVIDGPVTITTDQGVRSATIQATPAGDDLTVASTVVTEMLEEVQLPDGVTAAVGGVLSEQQNAFKQLGLALLAAILIVYIVMVATFRSLLQPILLLISVPFAATGAIIMLIVTGVPLGVASLIGVLMLVGIVVTNAIVLIDLVNQLRARGYALKDAVRTGAAHRYRPILMTAFATIFALTPMALGITGKGGFISQPLAVVVIGGLLSSTVLTLIVLPTLYYVTMRPGEKKRLQQVKSRRARRRSGG